MAGLAANRRAGLVGLSVLARLPLAMFSIPLLIYAHQLTGSFALAGLASGAYVVGRGISSPMLVLITGAFTDRSSTKAMADRLAELGAAGHTSEASERPLGLFTPRPVIDQMKTGPYWAHMTFDVGGTHWLRGRMFWRDRVRRAGLCRSVALFSAPWRLGGR